VSIQLRGLISLVSIHLILYLFLSSHVRVSLSHLFFLKKRRKQDEVRTPYASISYNEAKFDKPNFCIGQLMSLDIHSTPYV
jgi:hypothetical protein